MRNLKTNLECEILGQTIAFSDTYTRIGSIVSIKNFEAILEGIHCGKIFEAITTLYPLTHCDLLTISKKVSELCPNVAFKTVAWVISDLCKNVVHNVNVEHHCYMLVQMCVQDEFEKILAEISTTSNAILKVEINEIFASLKLGYDIFDIITKSGRHLIELGFETEAKKIIALDGNITLKVRSIKAANQIQTLARNVEKLVCLNAEKKEELRNHIYGIIKIIGY